METVPRLPLSGSGLGLRGGGGLSCERAINEQIMNRWIALMALMLLTASCHVYRVPAEREVTRQEVTETVRDTFVVVEPDSALIRAYLECQSGRVALTRLISMPGARIVPHVTLTDVLTDTGYRGALLNVQCHEDSLRQEIALRDRTIREMTDRVRTEYITVERPFRWYHRALMGGGYAFLALLLGMAAWLVVRIYIKGSRIIP